MTAMAFIDDLLDARSAEIAEAVLGLLVAGPRWRHRRVETLDPLSGTLVRRRVSLDFSVPSEFHDGLRLTMDGKPSAERAGPFVVPLAWLARRQLVDFDLRDRSNKSVPLALGAQTAVITRDVLLLAAIESGLDPTSSIADDVIDVVLEASSDRPPTDRRALRERAASFGLGADFESLIRASADGFLLLAVLDDIGGRQIVKWQSDEVRPRSGFVVRFRVAGLNEVASTHVELELPDVLHANRIQLWDDWVSSEDSGLAHDSRLLGEAVRQGSPSTERPRLLLGPAPSARRPHVRVHLRVSSGEFVMPALVLAFLALVILVVGVSTSIGEAVAGSDARGTASAAATVLLSAFAALSGLVLRVETHPLVRTLLARPRAALGYTAVGLVVAAAPIGLQLDAMTVDLAWGLALFMSLGSVAVIADTLVNGTDVRG
jgi:hypothetical protein